MEKLREGDLGAFRQIYDKYHKKIYGYCYKLCGDRQASEELTEDVFVRLWEKREVLDVCRDPGPLLFKITRDFAWSFLKQRSRRKVIQENARSLRAHERSPKVESDLTLSDYISIAEGAIRQLPPRRRKVFVLHYRDGLDNKSIAEALNISESTVRVQLLKSVRYLRDFMRAHPEMPFSLLLFVC